MTDTHIYFLFLCLFSLLLITVARRNNIENVINTKDNLELVHVLFRHGDRTPERTYPNDVYTAADYHPTGFSQLTNKGIERSYKLGRVLRSTYDKFLGDVYYPAIVNSISSHPDRCKTSLQAVLAGLFAPQGNQVWNSELNWRPIPFNAFSSSRENKMFSPFASCAKFGGLVTKEMEGIHQDPNINRYSDKFDHILKHAGLTDIGYTIDVLYSALKSQQEFGLPLPNWTKSVWPEPISDMQKYVFKYYVMNDNLKSIALGYLLKKIVDNTYLTVTNNSSSSGRKMYLYSGHDTGIVGLLMLMDNFVPHCPPYNAYIIFEVHNIDGIRYLKIMYENYKTEKLQTIRLSCGMYCTIDQFVTLYSKYMNTTAIDALCC